MPQRWMIKRLRKHTQLEVTTNCLNPAHGPIENCIDGKGVESRTALYLTSHAYPYLRTLCGVLTPPTGKMDGLIRNRFNPENSRRNLPPTDEETVNECLHISALQRWQLPQVAHDLTEDKSAPLQPNRPPNLLLQHPGEYQRYSERQARLHPQTSNPRPGHPADAADSTAPRWDRHNGSPSRSGCGPGRTCR